MNELAGPRSYVARANALEYEAIWRLQPDALELQGGPTAGPDVVLRFPYRDIAGVRLSYAPSRADHARYRCDLRMRSGQQIAILSTHYAGIADFEDRAATYAPFVRALIARVAAANPRRASVAAASRSPIGRAPLPAGDGRLHGVRAVADRLRAAQRILLAKFAFILASIPLLIVYTRKNWPSRFKPDTTPKDVLP